MQKDLAFDQDNEDNLQFIAEDGDD